MTLQPAAPTPSRARGVPYANALSLERKLPLLMTAVLAVVLALSLFFTYGALARSEEASARERLARAARQLASTVDAAVIERAARLRAATRDSALRRALARAPGTDTVRDGALARDALARFRAPGDSALGLELWDARGRRVAFVGPDLGSEERAAAPPPDSAAGAASVRFGPLYASRGSVYFWTVAPVVVGGRPVGYVAHQRRVQGPREAPQSLRALLGDDVAMYIRNAAGTFWATAPGAPVSPPARTDSGPSGLFNVRAGVGRTIVAEAAIEGAPWLMVLESPLRAVYADARSTMTTLALLSAALIVVGAALSWAISRRITRPLASLTAAAEAIARGEYGRHVDHAGRDEIGRLSASFNQMASDVATSRRELEQRVEDTQAAAAALERANTRLHHAIGEAERARSEAEQAREDAERANHAKSDFLAMMSHELRTPLNAIGGYAQLLEMGVFGAVTDEQRDALVRLARSQAHLLALINDVLNFARIDAGQVHYAIADVAVDEAISGLEPLVAPQVRTKGLAFAWCPCDPRLTVRADRERLHQIMLNLLTNAIKFTPAGGRVSVECDATDDLVRFRVRDTGVGIPPERVPSIFDPFVQGERALNRPNDGVGLGLAIARDLARGMGGDIAVESEVGRGSTFTLTLPRWAAGARGVALESSGATYSAS